MNKEWQEATNEYFKVRVNHAILARHVWPCSSRSKDPESGREYERGEANPIYANMRDYIRNTISNLSPAYRAKVTRARVRCKANRGRQRNKRDNFELEWSLNHLDFHSDNVVTTKSGYLHMFS